MLDIWRKCGTFGMWDKMSDIDTYKDLGKMAKDKPNSWMCFVFTESLLGKTIRFQRKKKIGFKN